MKVHGWEFRLGVANPRSFNHVGASWEWLVNGLALWVGASPLFMFYIGVWQEDAA